MIKVVKSKEFEDDLNRLYEKYEESKELIIPANRRSLRLAITYCVGILCGISILFIILDIVRLLLAYHLALSLVPFIVKLFMSALVFGSIIGIIWSLEIDWRSIWTIISGSFALFGIFFTFYSGVFDIWVWVKISEVEFWVSTITVYFFLIVCTVLAWLRNRRIGKVLHGFMQLENEFCKKWPREGEVLKSCIKQSLVESKLSLKQHEKEWLKATGEKF